MEKSEATGRTEAEKKPKQQCFRKAIYRTSYLPELDTEFTTRISLLYDVFESSTKQRTPIWWSDCCQTMVRNIDLTELGHPKPNMPSMKAFLKSKKITSRETFVEYMVNNLPRNEAG